MSDYFTDSNVPATAASIDSSVIRAAFDDVGAGFDKLPGLTGNGDKAVFVNAGGTALTAVTAATARTNLGLVIGTNVQAWDADLDALAALASTAGMLSRTGAGAFAVRTITGTAAEITVSDGSGASANPTLSLPASLTFTGKTITGGTFSSPTLTTPALGTPASGVATNLTGTASGLTAGNVTTNANLTGPITSVGNATTISDYELSAIAGLTSAADRLPYFTGAGTAALATFTAAGRALVDDADNDAQLKTLGLQDGKPFYYVATGTNVYAATPVPALDAYADGQPVFIKINSTNTGSSSLNLNALGAGNIITTKGNALSGGELQAGGGVYCLVRDGSNFVLLNPTPGGVTSSSVAVASAVSLTTGVAANMTSISLAAGDWDVQASVAYDLAATTNITLINHSISQTSATMDNTTGGASTIFRYGAGGLVAASNIGPFPTATIRITLSSATTIYAVARCDFTVSRAKAYGLLKATRVR